MSRHSIDDAAFWFIAPERVCQQQLLVEATGINPQVVSQETAEYSREHVGSDHIGWLHFQTLYGHVAATQPDMFDWRMSCGEDVREASWPPAHPTVRTDTLPPG